MSALTHLDERGAARIVDVREKQVTVRRAVAAGRVEMSAVALQLIREGGKKGDALAVARIAGIQAAKRTSEWIPLCHQVPLDHVRVDFEIDEAASCVRIQAEASATWRTGVEMEALVAVGAAALAIYDMAKAVDRAQRIEGIHLVEKDGGRSGPFRAPPAAAP